MGKNEHNQNILNPICILDELVLRLGMIINLFRLQTPHRKVTKPLDQQLEGLRVAKGAERMRRVENYLLQDRQQGQRCC